MFSWYVCVAQGNKITVAMKLPAAGPRVSARWIGGILTGQLAAICATLGGVRNIQSLADLLP